MYLIRALTISTTIAAALFVMGCAHKTDALAEHRMAAAACVDNPPPSDAEIRKMSTSDLYRWYKMALRASDELATLNAHKAMRTPDLQIPPCLRALAWKQDDFERELKYR